MGLGEHVQAIALYRQLLAASPGSADLHVSLGHALQTVGQQKEATESYQNAATVLPSFGDAWWSLANLKTYRFSQSQIGQMLAAEAAPVAHLVDRYHLCFALGRAFEDRNEYAESWRFYERGNQLKHAESRYRPEIIETNARSQIEVCTAQFFAGRAGVGVPDPDPIFIVGLPHAPDRRLLSRSLPLTRRSKARTNSPNSSVSCLKSAGRNRAPLIRCCAE